MSELASVDFDGENIVVKMPLKWIKYFMSHHPEFPLYVSNEEEFVKYYKNNFLDFDTTMQYDGLSNFYRLLDEFSFDMYESGGPVFDPTELDSCNYDVELDLGFDGPDFDTEDLEQ